MPIHPLAQNTVLPPDRAPPKLRNQLMIHLPPFKIQRAPHPAFIRPRRAHLLKLASQIPQTTSNRALQAFIILRYDVEGFFEHARGVVHRGRYRAEVGFEEEDVGGGDGEERGREAHRVQPVSDVLDLGGGEEEAGFPATHRTFNST